jgi:hypothetical protein
MEMAMAELGGIPIDVGMPDCRRGAIFHGRAGSCGCCMLMTKEDRRKIDE